MINKSVEIARVLLYVAALPSVVLLAGCAGTSDGGNAVSVVTPTVDYIEGLDVYSAPHQDSFLNQLAMNYRSYAIYNARTSGYPEVGELFAQKAVAAFSGEVPFPETLENWPVSNQQESYELYTAYNDLMTQLKNDASDTNPELAAEMQAKFDCWASAAASGQRATADQCRSRFLKALAAMRDCKGGRVVRSDAVVAQMGPKPTDEEKPSVAVVNNIDMQQPVAHEGLYDESCDECWDYYPETRDFDSVHRTSSPRDGVIIVNNVNVPEHLIKTEPVPPMVFNQNIYGGDKSMSNSLNNNANDSSNHSDNSTTTVNATDSNSVDNSFSDSSSRSSNSTTTLSTTDNSIQDNSIRSINDSFNDSSARSYTENVTSTGNGGCNCSCGQQNGDAQAQGTACSCNNGTVGTCDATPINIMLQSENSGEIPMLGDEVVSRDEFINMMMAMRNELKAINDRLDNLNITPVGDEIPTIAAQAEKTLIKVQQIPVEAKQHVMEEVFEIRFDFNKATIKPEYKKIIKDLAEATQENKNIKVSVVGHTDTKGTSSYNYALGGERAAAVQKMLIKYGIPASQIVAVSAGEEDLAVPTGDNVANAENRRVRVVKETPYVTEELGAPVLVDVSDISESECGSDTCGM